MSISNIAINFINDNVSSINEASSVGTGDNFLIYIVAALCLFVVAIYVLTYIFSRSKRNLYSLNTGKHALRCQTHKLSDCVYWKLSDSKFILKFFIAVVAVVAAISLGFSAFFAKNNIAYASDAAQNFTNYATSSQADTPDSITAHINFESNNVVLDTFEIKNNKENNFYFNKVTFKDSLGTSFSNWKMTNNGKTLYDNTPNQQNSLGADCVCIKADSSITINIETNMSSDFAMQYVNSVSPFSIELVFDTIPDTHQHAIEPNITSGLSFNGQQQEGVVANNTISLDGDYVAKNAGEYKATATPKEGYMWDDATQTAKEYDWVIAKATTKLDLSSQSVYINPSEELTITITTVGDGELNAKIDDESVATTLINKEEKTLKVTALAAGQTQITLSISETNNSTSANVVIPVVVGQHFTGKAYDYIDSSTQSSIDIQFNFNPHQIVNLDNNTYNPNLAYLTASLVNDSPDSLVIDLDGYDKWEKTNNTKLYENLQMSDVEEHVSKPEDYQTDKDDLVNVILSHKKINDQGVDKELVLITLQNCANSETPDSWYSNFDIGCDCDVYNKYQHPDWLNVNNHKGFDIAFNRIKKVINAYIAKNVDTTAQVSTLLTAHSRSAAVCNLLAQDYTENTNYKVFSYCLATPSPQTTSTNKNYPNIITIQNDDDIIPYFPLKQWGFGKYSDGNYYGINIADEANKSKWEETTGIEYQVMDPNGEGGLIPALYNKLSKTREGLYNIKDQGEYAGGSLIEPITEFDTEAEAETAKNEMITELAKTSLDKYQEFKVVTTEEGKYTIDIKMSPSFAMSFAGRIVNTNFVDGMAAVALYFATISSYVTMPENYTSLILTLMSKGSAISCSHSQYSYYFVVDQLNKQMAK